MAIHIVTSPDQPQPAVTGAGHPSAGFPTDLAGVLANIAPRPLNRDDDPAGPYEALLAHVIAEVKPVGLVEHVWVRDFVDLTAEVMRLRSLKADLLTTSAGEGLRKVLIELDAAEYYTLSKRWHARQPDAIAKVEATLAAAGLGLGAVRAQALAVRIDEVEAIDRMIRSAEARRDEMLRQLYRHQADLATRLRNAADAHEQMAKEVHEIEIVPSPVQTGQYVEAGG